MVKYITSVLINELLCASSLSTRDGKTYIFKINIMLEIKLKKPAMYNIVS